MSGFLSTPLVRVSGYARVMMDVSTLVRPGIDRSKWTARDWNAWDGWFQWWRESWRAAADKVEETLDAAEERLLR